MNAQGSKIQGTFRHKVTYPAGEEGTSSTEFSTVRPTFAEDHLPTELGHNPHDTRPRRP